MKLVKITTAYPFYLKKFYNEHPGLSQETYQKQKEALDFDGFGLADFWESALGPLGYQVKGYLANAESLQKTWARENGSRYTENNWLLDIIEAQILKEKPEVLFVVDYVTFTRQWLNELREKCPSIRLIIGWCGAPFPDEEVFKAYDLTLSCIPELVELFRKMGHQSEHVNHAFDPRILQRLDLETKPAIDFSFVGQIVRTNQFHLEREYILERLVSRVNIQLFCPSYDSGLKDDLKVLAKSGIYGGMKVLKAAGFSENGLAKLPVVGKAARWQTPPVREVNPKLKPLMRPPVFGLQMFQTLRNSKATFNSHIDISPRSASNLRLFEATGVGTCLVTDWKENIRDLFEPDIEVVTYSSPEECIEKVNWLIEHPAERDAIAKAGQARTLACNTFNHRAAQLNEILRKSF